MARRARKQKRTQPQRDVDQAYKQLLDAIERANTVQGGSADLSEAGRILSANPQLVKFLQAAQGREQAKQDALNRLDSTKASPIASASQSGMAGWTGTQNYPQGVPNARLLREWADSNEWVRSAINNRRQQIERADIAVLPLDERKPYNRPVMKSMQQLLDQPNELRDSWRSLIGPAVEDILVLDRGCISKNMTLSRKPTALYYEDGATIKIYPDWSGDPKEPRYLYELPGGSVKKPLLNDELICIAANGASYRFSLSPVQVLRQTIVADLEASKSAAHMVSMKPPPAALQIVGASETQLRGIMSNYDNEIAGRKELFMFGGPQQAHLFPLVFSAKDNQWMEWQEYLARKICAIFQISPQQIGLTFDINKATSGTQQQIFEDTGLIPLLLLIEEYLNRELLADFAPKMKGDRANLEALNLRIVFPEVSEAARQLHVEKTIALAESGLAGLPSMTLNQLLMMRGEEPVPKGGNTFWVMTTNGPMPWLSYDNEYGDYTPLVVGGELGGQDPAGGMDEDESVPTDGSNEENTPNFNDETPDQSAPTTDMSGTENATKSYLVRDTRKPGINWRPGNQYTLTRAHLLAGVTRQRSAQDEQARKVLQDAVARVFHEAAQKGQKALLERREEA